ncbi:MAG: hypothetical protein NTX25_21895 [Proteobacteria bacterium]|nr:hypothetical protein [Pseudomonadota bacterium]
MSESQKSSQIFQAKVLHLSQQGLGVVKAPDGKTYFVRGVWRGDEVELIPRYFPSGLLPRLSTIDAALNLKPMPSSWAMLDGRVLRSLQ